MKIPTALFFLCSSSAFVAGQMTDPPQPDGERMDYEHKSMSMRGFVSIPEGASAENKVPAVVIIPDW